MVKTQNKKVLSFKEYLFGGGSGLIIASFLSDFVKIDLLSIMAAFFFLGTSVYIFIAGDALSYIHPDFFRRFVVVDFKKHPIVFAYGKDARKIGFIYLILGILCLLLGKSFFGGFFKF